MLFSLFSPLKGIHLYQILKIYFLMPLPSRASKRKRFSNEVLFYFVIFLYWQSVELTLKERIFSVIYPSQHNKYNTFDERIFYWNLFWNWNTHGIENIIYMIAFSLVPSWIWRISKTRKNITIDNRDKVHVISILSQRYKKNGNANCSHQADIHILKNLYFIVCSILLYI